MNDIASYNELNKQFGNWWEGYMNSDIEEKWSSQVAARAAFMDAWRRAEDCLLAEPISEYVERRIHEVFLEVAEMVNNSPLQAGESVGIPMKLFQGEILLTNAWKQFCERGLHE